MGRGDIIEDKAALLIAQFLGRAWSEKPRLIVKLDVEAETPHATMTFNGRPLIRMPPPSRYPLTEFVSAYRLWRTSLWRMAMHHYYGLPKVNYGYYTVGFFVLNCIERYKIEFNGVKEYPGMMRELKLEKATYFLLAPPPEDVVEEFAQLLLMEAIKGKSPSPQALKAVKYVKEAVAKGLDSSIITCQVCEILGVDPNDYYEHSLPESIIGFAVHPQKNPIKKLPKELLRTAIMDWLKARLQQIEQSSKNNVQNPKDQENRGGEGSEGKTDRSTAFKDQGMKGETPESLNEETEEILEVSDNIRSELDEWERIYWGIIRGRKGAISEVKDGVLVPSEFDEDESQYYDQELINHLVSKLRHLRKGWKEVPSISGELDVDSYVAGSHKPFIDEEQIKVGGLKVLLLLDHSSSIEGFEKEYKVACVALAEALNALKIPFAIYAFAEYHGPTSIWLIKRFEEPWSRICAKRLAQVKAGGGTPLATVYERLKLLVQRHRSSKLRFITLTDGEPDSRPRCRDKIRELKKYCRMIAIAIGTSMENAVQLAQNLSSLGYDRYVALDNVKKLPEKVLNLLSE